MVGRGQSSSASRQFAQEDGVRLVGDEQLEVAGAHAGLVARGGDHLRHLRLPRAMIAATFSSVKPMRSGRSPGSQ
jgi:hypothetical protein